MVWQKKRYVTWPNLLDDIRWGYWMNSVFNEANRWLIPYWCSHKINNWNGCDRNKTRPTCSNAFGEANGYEILLVWIQDNRYLVSGMAMVLKIRMVRLKDHVKSLWGYNFQKKYFVRLNDLYKSECGQWIDHFIYGGHLKHFSNF